MNENDFSKESEEEQYNVSFDHGYDFAYEEMAKSGIYDDEIIDICKRAGWENVLGDEHIKLNLPILRKLIREARKPYKPEFESK